MGRVVRGVGVGVAALVAAAGAAGAQVMRVPRGGTGEPVLWGSGWTGFLQTGAVSDGSSGSTWDFGSSLQYRGSIELTVERGLSVGLAASYARPSLVYSSTLVGVCGAGCAAHAAVRELLASVHVGGGPGLHQVIQLSLGVVNYADFRADASGASLAPAGGDTDPAFAIGYGIAYGVRRAAQIVLVQEYGASVHQRDNAPANANSLTQHFVTRLGLRVGLGGR